jgi:uncharacterized protein YkwD
MLLRRTSAVLFSSMAVAAACITSLPTSASAQTTTNCPVSSTDQAIDSEEQTMLNLINQYRQQYGKNALAMHPTVTRPAAWFSRDMATKNYIPADHVDSLGRNPGTRLRQCGAGWMKYAENLAAGNGSAQGTFDQWRNSPGHNANMLADGVTVAGVARAFNAGTTYGWYWTLKVTAPGITNVNVASIDPGDTFTVSATGVASANTGYGLRFGTSEERCHTSPLALGGTVTSDSNFNIPTVRRTVPTNVSSGVRWVCWVAVDDTQDHPAPARLTIL